MKKIDYMKQGYKPVTIIDRTCIQRYNKAIPTSKNMERQLSKISV